jgi:uncharacterized FAD-dependent dehydrogenase
MLEKFARTIEVEVFPDEFVYRYGGRERRVPTRGYIRKVKDSTPSYLFEEQPTTDEYMPVNLFSSLPADLQEDIIDVLAAFLVYGVRPLCSFVRPIIVFTGVERLRTGFGFEYAAFREAAKLFAFGDKGVYLHQQKP